ncbi:MAG: helix-turn-helix transcriptional regulator [Planctomycetota bacterium]|nr:helix-turn-helix transcriptional regulator [Planctomycetota bacterium]
MIRNEKEYKQALGRIRQERQRLAGQEAQLKAMGLKAAEIKRAMDPMRSFHRQLAEEVRSYERLKRGQFDPMHNLYGLGQMLVSLRIARGLSQRQLARKLGVHETQVSRDERNEYHSITLERAGKVLEALGVQVHSRVALVKAKKAGAA